MTYNQDDVNEQFISDAVAAKGEKKTFYITKDNADGSREIVYHLKCDMDRAYAIFLFVVSEQQIEYRNSGYSVKWRVVRLCDAKTHKQICQES